MLPRKFIVIIITFLILITGVTIVTFLWKENKTVTFIIDYPGASAIVKKKGSDDTIATVTNGSSLRLAKQIYSFQFTDPAFNQNPIEAEVTDQTNSITLKPLLSNTKLNELLAADKEAIDSAIKNVAKNAFSYIEGRRRLHNNGQWCTTSFIVPAAPSSLDPNIGSPDNSEVYYLILEKKDNKWSVVAGPHLIITKPDFPNIPAYIIDDIDPSVER